MIFRDVQLIYYGKSAELRLEQNRFLMEIWENLRNIFCINLPTKLDLGGISKVNIYLGNFDGSAFESPSSNGIAAFRRSDFIFDEFCTLSDHDKQETSLFYIEDSLRQICRILNTPEQTIIDLAAAAAAVREGNFEIRKVYKKTTKWNKNRSLKAVTKLHHKTGGIDVDLFILDPKENIVAQYKIIEGRFWEGVWFDLWKGVWQGSNFVIENRVGTVFCSVDVTGSDGVLYP